MTAPLVGSRLLFRMGEIRSTSAIAYARYDKKRGHTPTLGMTKKGGGLGGFEKAHGDCRHVVFRDAAVGV